ncbi:hypothetical protein [Motilibacter deserti]|uniref:Uncharacterized protein n=1 Tax=Motilibacter deserti TaxID=2714956 RepID=A0ABX0GYE1_9ACTN|nr:hypothetical protein [Motilibacter deserti]NHC15847.1 hypothetical protein [Motilibacter deserti]
MEPKLVYDFGGWIEVRSADPACLAQLYAHASAHGLKAVLQSGTGQDFDHLLRVEVSGDDPRLADAVYAFTKRVDQMVVDSC